MRQTITTQIAVTDGRLHAIVPLDPKEVGRRLKAARERKGWTQLEFALKIGKSPSSVSRWDRGFLPPVRELMRIAEVLEIEPAELIEDQRSPDEAILARLDELTKLYDPIRELLDEVRAQANLRSSGRKKV
jgi:transcriptional regulator with XRE-family HTH domain